MKTQWIPALLLVICLTACTPAASTAPEPAPVTEQTAESAAETATEETAAFPVGHLRALCYRESTADAVYNAAAAQPEGGDPVLQLLKVDLADALRSSVFAVEGENWEIPKVVPYENSVCLFANGAMYRVPQSGGEAEVLPLGDAFAPDYADEYSAYDFVYNYPDSRTDGARLDLATGALTPLQLPSQTMSRGARADLGRLFSTTR